MNYKKHSIKPPMAKDGSSTNSFSSIEAAISRNYQAAFDELKLSTLRKEIPFDRSTSF